MNLLRRFGSVLSLLLPCCVADSATDTAVAADGASPPQPVRYLWDIKPVLSDRCYTCHGPDEASREADLRFDVRKSAVDYGAIVPGDADDSLLIERIAS